MNGRRITRREFAVGVGLGLLGSAAVLPWLRRQASAPQPQVPRAVLSDCDGPIRDLVVHYTVDAVAITAAAYRDFFGHLPTGITAHVVCPDRAAFDDLVKRVGETACRLTPLAVEHAVTCWSRDRWLALAPSDPRISTVLLSPRGENGASLWAARQGDQRVAGDLAAALFPAVASRRSELFFDGGDFVADSETVFVTPAVLMRNLQQTVGTRRELEQRLASVLRRKVVLLHRSPDHHAGMFMMTAGDRTVLVGDPSAAEAVLFPQWTEHRAKAAARVPLSVANRAARIAPPAAVVQEPLLSICPPEGPDFSSATQQRFDAVAGQCEEAGYRVVRIPVVPGRDGRSYLSYVNAILDQRDRRRIVYLPVFRGVEALNLAAAEVWAGLGFEVRPVDCTDCYAYFGTLRCLVNVLRRGDSEIADRNDAVLD